jgi:hypothetical protein
VLGPGRIPGRGQTPTHGACASLVFSHTSIVRPPSAGRSNALRATVPIGGTSRMALLRPCRSNERTPAYAITSHRAQGSEWPSGVVVHSQSSYLMLRPNLRAGEQADRPHLQDCA